MTTRVGILSGKTISKWKLKALRKAVNKTDAKITLVVVDNRVTQNTKGHMLEALRGGLWEKYHKLSWKLNPPKLRESEAIENQPLFSEAKFHYCKPLPADGIGETFPAETVELAKEECDLLFRSGFGIIKGNILTATEHGVVSYHSGDIRKYRGKPPGFWEYMNGDDTAGVTLQQLNETLDGGKIVVFEEINISKVRTWRKVRDELDTVAIGMMAKAIKQLTNPAVEPLEVTELGEIYTNPTNIQMLRYLSKNFYAHLIGRCSDKLESYIPE